MSRHRNVRSMNYSDEYDGYDDVYGHSVEDDYCVSPSQAAFMYDREGPTAKPKIGTFLERDNDIAEENEDLESKENNLSHIDQARLESCIEQLKKSGIVTSSKQELIDTVLACNFNVEKSLKFLKNSLDYVDNKQEKDVKVSLKSTKKNFAIPKLNVKFGTALIITNKNEDYTSLADLANHHLNQVGLNRPDIFDKKLERVVQTVSHITLDDKKEELKSIRSLNTLENDDVLNSDCQIDLTKALRSSKSAPQVRPQLPETEYFVPKFVDCETSSYSLQKTVYDCCMDISWILKVSQRNRKRPSRFGKLICTQYKTSQPLQLNDYNYTGNIEMFGFDSPSPDDCISNFLHRS